MKSKEIFKDIPDYDGRYQISTLGRVKSIKRKNVLNDRMLKPILDSKGYFKVGLNSNNTYKSIRIHRLISMTFLDHKPNGTSELVCNHKNFDKTDNRLENLELITNRENSNLMHIPSSSKYVGVYWAKYRNKWRSRIVIDGKLICLGSYKNEFDAHLAYQKTLNELKD